MKRALLKTVTGLSLAGCIAAALAWSAGPSAPGPFQYRLVDARGRRTGDVSAWSWRGRLVVQVGRLLEPVGGTAAVREPAPGPAEFTRWTTKPWMSPLDPSDVGVAGFWVGSYSYTFEPTVGHYVPFLVTNRVVIVPWYAVILATAALPLLRLRRVWIRRRGAAAGRCVSCGYDLRATPDRCPECGTSTAGAALSAAP